MLYKEKIIICGVSRSSSNKLEKPHFTTIPPLSTFPHFTTSFHVECLFNTMFSVLFRSLQNLTAIIFYWHKVRSLKNLMLLFFSQSFKYCFLNSLDLLLKDENHWRKKDGRKAKINTELKRTLKTGSLCPKVLFTKAKRL